MDIHASASITRMTAYYPAQITGANNVGPGSRVNSAITSNTGVASRARASLEALQED